MNDRLDEELKALSASESTPRAYEELEAAVWRRIANVRQARRAAPALYAVRAAGVAGALTLGVVAGGATAVAVAGEMQEISVFSIETQLAPSTLLDHHGGGG